MSASVGLKVLYFSRFLAGVGVGLMSALVPSYIAECSPRAIRGRCTGAIEVYVGLGNMLACGYIFRLVGYQLTESA